MNKRQKEVIQAQLDSEKAVLEQLEKHYTRALSDIDKKIRILQSDDLTQSRIYRLEYQKALKKQVEAVLEKLHSDEYTTVQQFLSQSYTDAFVGTAYDMFGQGVPIIMPVDPEEAVKAVITDSKINGTLYESLGVDVKKLKKSISSEISRGIAGGMSYSEIARNISNTTKAPMSRAKTIVQTESHRIQQAATHNAQVKAKSKGANVVKQWCSTLDGGTRDTHRRLDGQIREVEEPFEMSGLKAMYPGDFGDPAEDCNCRCVTLQRAKWALDEAELETLKERAKYFELDKTDDFESFKKSYLKAAEQVKTVENSEKKSIIKSEKSAKTIKPSQTIRGHAGTPKQAEPNSVIDHLNDAGEVDARGFYNDSGMKEKDIHTNDHGNPKRHDYGQHGEHAHDYEWTDDGKLKNKTIREIDDDERERNGNIL